MNYIQIAITAEKQIQELLIAQLTEIGFDGFEETDTILKAFIQEELFNLTSVTKILVTYNLSFQQITIPKQNWNEVWESNFSPVIIDDFVGIRANFHQNQQNVEYEIVITPKMSFGTGHHATTFSVIQLMREVDFKNKIVFDFGTGTGILAILAEKLGASKVLAVDNDDWCIENATENCTINNCQTIDIHKVTNAQSTLQFQIVIANINKNIILENLQFLQNSLASNGVIILSGLLAEDEADILKAVQSLNWHHQKTIQKGMWIAMLFNN